MNFSPSATMDSIETQSVVHLSVRALAESSIQGLPRKPVYGGLSFKMEYDSIDCALSLAEAFCRIKSRPEVTLNGIINWMVLLCR